VAAVAHQYVEKPFLALRDRNRERKKVETQAANA
jgi:hypothetical protein